MTLAVAPLASPADAQNSLPRFALELHAGYGGGGLHSDEVVGGGVSYRFGAVEAIGFATAVVSEPGGRAVFMGLGPRVFAAQGRLRPYLSAGPLLSIRSYDEGHLGVFGALGLDVGLGAARRWRLFAEAREMRGGTTWAQLVGGVRRAIAIRSD